MKQSADPSGRAVYGVGLRPLACWDCGIDARRGHGCLSLMSIVCCQVERRVVPIVSCLSVIMNRR